VDRQLGIKGDIVAKAPESSTVAVDRIDLELGPFLDRPLSGGGQSVDRQA